MPRQKRSISFADETMRFVDGFPSRHRGLGNFTTRAEEIIIDYAALLARTKQELLFAESELGYIYDMLSSATVQVDLPIRTILAASVMDADRYDGLGEKWGIDPGALSQKISNLTEFQAYVLTKMADEYWNNKLKL